MITKKDLHYKRKIAREENEIKRLMTEYLDGLGVVQEVNYGPQRNYIYKCPECQS